MRRQVEHVERLFDDFQPLKLGHALRQPSVGRHRQRLDNGEIGDNGCVRLRHETDDLLEALRAVGDVVYEYGSRSRAAVRAARQHVEKRRLARARRTHNGSQTAGRNSARDAFQYHCAIRQSESQLIESANAQIQRISATEKSQLRH